MQTTDGEKRTSPILSATALPIGANRVFYTRNHDTSWFYHFNGYTPRFMSMEAVRRVLWHSGNLWRRSKEWAAPRRLGLCSLQKAFRRAS
ncbi:MAG: hypothetical protein WKF84_21385 [Pyrinomonadaceae bacterium]